MKNEKIEVGDIVTSSFHLDYIDVHPRRQLRSLGVVVSIQPPPPMWTGSRYIDIHWMRHPWFTGSVAGFKEENLTIVSKRNA